jgi:hypothetical protein
MPTPTVIKNTTHAAIIKTECGFGVVTFPCYSWFGRMGLITIGQTIGDKELGNVDTIDISLPEAEALLGKIEKFYEIQESQKRRKK